MNINLKSRLQTTCKEKYFKKIAKSNFLKYVTPKNLMANAVNNNNALLFFLYVHNSNLPVFRF